MPHPHRARILATSLLAAMLAFPSAAQNISPDDDANGVYVFSTPLPLGMDAYILRPAGKEFYLLSSIEDRRFNRLQVSRVRSSRFVMDANGDVWKHYPDEITFRLTATAKTQDTLKMDTDTIDEKTDLNSFLLGLKFRLKAYRGLQMSVVPPSSVRMIGMPADVAYDERVYRITFETGEFPVDTRLVMEVLSPGGQMLSRFHLELL